MSFHIQPSEKLKAIIDAHVGPTPECPKDRTEITLGHPDLVWAIQKHKVLTDALDQALQGCIDAMEAHEKAVTERIEGTNGREEIDFYFYPGEISLTVLGHPCRLRDASVDRVLGSYLGEIVLEEEVPVATN